MIALFNAPYRPSNYSQEEVTDTLEGFSNYDKKVKYALDNHGKKGILEIAKYINLTKPQLRYLLIKNKARLNSDLNKKIIILNKETGIYYTSTTEAAKTIGKEKNTFRGYLLGVRRKNQFNQWQIV